MSVSVCIVSCSGLQKEIYDENFIEKFSVSELSDVEKFTETVSLDSFVSTGFSKANEMAVTFDTEGMELPDVCIYSTDTLKNFNISDELYGRIRNKLSEYREMKSDYDYFFVIENYSCSCFVCTDGTDISIKNISGISAEGNYNEIYQSIYGEISLQ